MSLNVVTLLYLAASICFIQALKGLSHPTTSIRGNLFGMGGMGIAALTTAALIAEIAGAAGRGMAWVLRVPRRPDVLPRAENEARVLGLVKGRLPVEVPDWRIATPELIAYPRLAGPTAVT